MVARIQLMVAWSELMVARSELMVAWRLTDGGLEVN